MTVPATQERRTAERYTTARYSAKISREGWFKGYRPCIDAAVINFNRFGMLICCDNKLSIGEQVKFSLLSDSERAMGLVGVVKYVQRHQREFSIGLSFQRPVDHAASSLPNQDNILEKMEQVICRQLA